MLSLVDLTFDPFDLPGFKDIWIVRYERARSDTQKWLLDPGYERKFLIMLDDIPIGLTGYYHFNEDIGLAWHGIIPKYQGNGYGKEAFLQLYDIAVTDVNYLDAIRMVEIIPEDRESELSPFFLAMNFVKNPDEEVNFHWVLRTVKWIVYAKEIENRK